jgi:hypothetical protein
MSEIKLFQDKRIRSAWNEEEEQWYFSIEDVVSALTDSADPKQYIKRIRQRDEQLHFNWGTICTQVEMLANDGKRRKIMAANLKSLFRIIQSIPSPKAEPFKQWLAQVGYDRILEIENPESFAQSQNVAKRGGGVAGVARKETEKELGRSVVSSSKFLPKDAPPDELELFDEQ